MKEYPIHRDSQLAGQLGIWMVWLCTAITMAGASHTAHLHTKPTNQPPTTQNSSFIQMLATLPLFRDLLMKGLMLSPVMGAMDMGMGCGVDSQ